MTHAHGSLSAPFADIHVEDGVVRVTLLHDPVVDGVDMAIYIDGSASMSEEFEYRDDLPTHDDHDDDHAPPPAALGGAAMVEATPAKSTPKKGWIARLFGWFRDDDHTTAKDDHAAAKDDHPTAKDDHDDDDDDDDHDDDHDGPKERTNMVEPQVRRMLQYLATKDRNGRLRMAYWACGNNGSQIERIGELTGLDAETLAVPGPEHPGGGTRLKPALHDFVTYMEKQQAGGAKRGCGVFVTDGQISDEAGVKKFSAEIAGRIARGDLMPLHLVLVGVGEQVSERQMEELAHTEHPGVEHLWCHRVAEEMHQMAELVSGLVDSTMTVASGGTVYDARGNVVQRYERRLPAVLEFELPKGDTSFTLEIDGRRYTQALPDDDDH